MMHINDVCPGEVFNVAFVFEKKFIKVTGDEVNEGFVVCGKDAAVITAEANDEQTRVCFARDKIFCLETL